MEFRKTLEFKVYTLKLKPKNFPYAGASVAIAFDKESLINWYNENINDSHQHFYTLEESNENYLSVGICGIHETWISEESLKELLDPFNEMFYEKDGLPGLVLVNKEEDIENEKAEIKENLKFEAGPKYIHSIFCAQLVKNLKKFKNVYDPVDIKEIPEVKKILTSLDFLEECFPQLTKDE